MKQTLLNRYLLLERARAAVAAREAAEVVQTHVRRGRQLNRFQQSLTVDGVTLTMCFDPDAFGLTMAATPPNPAQRPGKQQGNTATARTGCLPVLVAAAFASTMLAML